MKEKIEILDDILQTRIRYLYKWNCVKISKHNKRNFSVKWYGYYMEDPDNFGLFQETTYPMKEIDDIINDQKRKLKKDIPGNEKEVLKTIL